MSKGYGYRGRDTFSGVTIGVRGRKKGLSLLGLSLILRFSFSRNYSIKSCKKRLTSLSYRSGLMFHDRMWVAPRKGA